MPNIPGPVGQLEAVVDVADTTDALAIICHPHSLQGGTMNNKVVTTVTRVFRRMGASTIRFNFRGVGESEGQYDNGIGETDDVLAVLAWAKKKLTFKNVYLAGFSFGSFVAVRAAAKVHPQKLLLIAPPVHHYDFAGLPPMDDCPWVVVQGEADEVVPPDDVYHWIDSLAKPPQLVRMTDTSHFFHGKLVELREALQAWLST